MSQNPYSPIQKENLQECAALLRGECHSAKKLSEEELNVILDLYSGVGGSFSNSPETIKKHLPTLVYFAENVRDTALSYENLLRAVLVAYGVFPKPEYPHHSNKGDATHDEVRAKVFSWVLDNTQDEALVAEISQVFSLPSFYIQAAVFISCENMSFMLSSGHGAHLREDNVIYYSRKAREEAVAFLRYLVNTPKG